ncbi:uncharacterized protein LOC143918336 [Arctopsyche grandis]|uniref:uncharacterized protein LOC143918336 n=1 Tax=Arctopsyche grandis TaxID=121162 RepID=UPI00406D8570
MEADSTTAEQEYECDSSTGHRENILLNELSRNYGYFRQIVLPMLRNGNEKDLLEWMREFNLIQPSVKCAKSLPDCRMVITASKVVDKYQWQCKTCNQKVQIRENSFFKNVYCPLQTIFKIILAWCQDMDYEHLSNVFGLKKQVVCGIYDKIERAVYGRPLYQLGGFGIVLLVDLYPDFVDELYPVSSKNDSAIKTQHKILCLADTNEIPTRYWLHVINGSFSFPSENNNTTFKKMNMCDETLHVIEKFALPGGLCAIGGGVHLTSLRENLRSSSMFEGVITMNHLTTHSNVDMQTFMINRIWNPIIRLCEAAQDLPKNKIQSYLSCALWRWQMESSDPFLSLVHLISQQDYKIPTNNKNSSKPR